MLGEEVTVYRRRRAGEDGMGEPVWEWDGEAVAGCLVRPLCGQSTPEQPADALRPDGVRVEYLVSFPKEYTATAESLAGCRVALSARGQGLAEALAVSGSPDRTLPCPTRWDMTAEVGRVDG